jgi:glucose-1-phosphate cytidylyltransferase
VPKTLVPINGRPLLDHLMDYLATAGVANFAVCVGYKAEAVEEFLQGSGHPAWEVACVDSGDATMTDRIFDARRVIRDRALICYGDTLANVDLAALLRTHESSGALATVTVYPLQSAFGLVDFDAAGRVSRFIEKPRLPYWFNIGFILCEAKALDRIQRGSDMPEFLSGLAADGVLGCYRHDGGHVTVNTPSDVMIAEGELIQLYTPATPAADSVS